jgi:hypothetical protein
MVVYGQYQNRNYGEDYYFAKRYLKKRKDIPVAGEGRYTISISKLPRANVGSVRLVFRLKLRVSVKLILS